MTGATGRIGRALVGDLEKLGIEIVTVSLSSTSDVSSSDSRQHVSWDLVNSPLPVSLMRGIDTVFHLAQVVGTQNQISTDPIAAHANCLVDRNIAISVEDSSVRRLVFASSSTAGAHRSLRLSDLESYSSNRLREPVGLFGSAKLTSERLFETLNSRNGNNRKVRYTNARIYTIFGGESGKNGGIIDWWLKNLSQDEPLVVIGAKQLRNFIHVSDVVRQLILLATDEEAEETTDIASDVTISLESAANLLLEKKSRTLHPIEYRPGSELWDHVPSAVMEDRHLHRQSVLTFPNGID